MNGPVHAPPRKTTPPLHHVRELAELPERRRKGEVFHDPATRLRFEKTRHRCGGCKQHVWFSRERSATLCRTEECPCHKPAQQSGTKPEIGN
jgi:hypothetical protein